MDLIYELIVTMDKLISHFACLLPMTFKLSASQIFRPKAWLGGWGLSQPRCPIILFSLKLLGVFSYVRFIFYRKHNTIIVCRLVHWTHYRNYMNEYKQLINALSLCWVNTTLRSNAVERERERESMQLLHIIYSVNSIGAW